MIYDERADSEAWRTMTKRLKVRVRAVRLGNPLCARVRGARRWVGDAAGLGREQAVVGPGIREMRGCERAVGWQLPQARRDRRAPAWPVDVARFAGGLSGKCRR